MQAHYWGTPTTRKKPFSGLSWVENGEFISSVLYGWRNPSGKLIQQHEVARPVSFPSPAGATQV